MSWHLSSCFYNPGAAIWLANSHTTTSTSSCSYSSRQVPFSLASSCPFWPARQLCTFADCPDFLPCPAFSWSCLLTECFTFPASRTPNSFCSFATVSVLRLSWVCLWCHTQACELCLLCPRRKGAFEMQPSFCLASVCSQTSTLLGCQWSGWFC